MTLHFVSTQNFHFFVTVFGEIILVNFVNSVVSFCSKLCLCHILQNILKASYCTE